MAGAEGAAGRGTARVNHDHYRNEQPPRRSVLSSGAVLLEVPVPAALAVSLGFWLRRGSTVEVPGREGALHLLEHMVFKGSERRSALVIAEAFDAIGAAVDAFTTKDYVAFTIKILPEFFETAVELLADMLLRPALDPGLLALEQDVVCEEIQEAFDTPEDRLHEAYAACVYQQHRRGRPILGTPETVRAMTADLLRDEHRRLFTGSNVVLAMAGNLLPQHHDLVLRAFGELQAGPNGESDDAGPPAPEAAGRQAAELVIQSRVVQTYFEIGNLAIPTAHPDRVPLLLCSNLLGGGMSSRIFQAVREREGLAYTVYNYTDMGRDTGLVSCAGSCSPRKAERVREVVATEYRRLIREGPTAGELAGNQAQIKSQLVFALEGVHNQMHRAAKNEIIFGRFMPMSELVTLVDGVDREKVQQIAATWFDPERMVYATHCPAPDRP